MLDYTTMCLNHLKPASSVIRHRAFQGQGLEAWSACEQRKHATSEKSQKDCLGLGERGTGSMLSMQVLRLCMT